MCRLFFLAVHTSFWQDFLGTSCHDWVDRLTTGSMVWMLFQEIIKWIWKDSPFKPVMLGCTLQTFTANPPIYMNRNTHHITWFDLCPPYTWEFIFQQSLLVSPENQLSSHMFLQHSLNLLLPNWFWTHHLPSGVPPLLFFFGEFYLGDSWCFHVY